MLTLLKTSSVAWKYGLILAGVLAYSSGLYWGGKYVAYREIAAETTTRYTRASDKQAKRDVAATAQATKDVTGLENTNRELRRLLSEVEVLTDRTACDLNDDELRILNEIVQKSSR